MIRTFFCVLIIVPCSIVFSQGQSIERLDSLVNEAILQNPAILREQANIERVTGAISQAGSLHDPEFIYKLMEFPGTNFSKARFQNFGIMQRITFPTKLSLSSDIAELDLRQARYQLLERVNEIASQVKIAYANLWAARTLLALNLDNQSLLDQILQSAETQYSVGRASQQDVLKTTIERSRTKNQEAALRQEIIASESQLRAILNRPSNTSIGPVETIPFTPVSRNIGELLMYARSYRPGVLADSIKLLQGDFMVRAQKQEYIPDFSLSLERVTMPMGGPSSWTVMAGISLPFAPWTLAKASSRVEQASAERSMRQHELISSYSQLDAEVRTAFARIVALESEVRSFNESIIPETEQSLSGLLTAYQTGQTTYLMLLDGYRTYQEVRMEATRARMMYDQALAQLERSVGTTSIHRVQSTSKEN